MEVSKLIKENEKLIKEIEEKTTILLAGAEKVKQLEKEIEGLKIKNKKLEEINYRVNLNFFELAETSISKDKIKEIINSSFPDYAIQKIIELLGE